MEKWSQKKSQDKCYYQLKNVYYNGITFPSLGALTGSSSYWKINLNLEKFKIVCVSVWTSLYNFKIHKTYYEYKNIFLCYMPIKEWFAKKMALLYCKKLNNTSWNTNIMNEQSTKTNRFVWTIEWWLIFNTYYLETMQYLSIIRGRKYKYITKKICKIKKNLK